MAFWRSHAKKRRYRPRNVILPSRKGPCCPHGLSCALTLYKAPRNNSLVKIRPQAGQSTCPSSGHHLHTCHAFIPRPGWCIQRIPSLIQHRIGIPAKIPPHRRQIRHNEQPVHSLTPPQATGNAIAIVVKMTEWPADMIDPNVYKVVIFSGSFENRDTVDAGLGKDRFP